MTGETNELLTRVGPGTPMGEFVRHHWIPALLVDRTREHLCAADTNIVRLRKRLAEAALRFRDEGKFPIAAENRTVYPCRPLGLQLAKGADWVGETENRRNPEPNIRDEEEANAG